MTADHQALLKEALPWLEGGFGDLSKNTRDSYGLTSLISRIRLACEPDTSTGEKQ